MNAKAGRLMCIDEGEYSDYQIWGFFVVLEDFDPLEELKLFLIENPDQRERNNFESTHMMHWLLKKGLLLEIDYNTLHLSNYGDVDEIYFRTEGERDPLYLQEA